MTKTNTLEDEVAHVAEELPLTKAIQMHLDQHIDNKAQADDSFAQVSAALDDMISRYDSPKAMTEEERTDLSAALKELRHSMSTLQKFVSEKL